MFPRQDHGNSLIYLNLALALGLGEDPAVMGDYDDLIPSVLSSRAVTLAKLGLFHQANKSADVRIIVNLRIISCISGSSHHGAYKRESYLDKGGGFVQYMRLRTGHGFVLSRTKSGSWIQQLQGRNGEV